ncbi:MAG: hypothetical protein LUG85_07595, partial [Clostridiales bacterium]|nr:hypothetical protein [Clostridiales bacterium]
DGSSESVTLKTDGKNIKMSTTMDMDSFGEYTISVIMVSSTNLLGRETTTTYIACDNTGKKMSLSTLQTLVTAFGGGDLDLDLNIENFTIGVDEVDDSMYAYVTTETGDDGVEYTVYSVDATDSVVKFYFDGDGISSIVTYDADGNIDATFVVDEFYTDISDSDFDVDAYDTATGLTSLFGISLLG